MVIGLAVATWMAAQGLQETIARPPKPGIVVGAAVTCPAPAHAAIVPFDQLPAEVLSDLRRTDPRMSPPGGPFNASDLIVDDTPQTRVVAAMRLKNRLAVAYERGGRGYGVTVLTYDRRPATGLFAIQGVHPVDHLKPAPGAPDPACAALERALGT